MADTETSGTRIFHQVKPSGRTGNAKLKLVPGKSIQAQTLNTSSVQVVSVPSALFPNNREQRESPMIPPGPKPKGQTPSLLPKTSGSITEAQGSSSPSVEPEAFSEKTVVFVRKSKNDQTVEPDAQADVQLRGVCLSPPSDRSMVSDTIRTFSKVARFPRSPNSPIRWVVEDTDPNPPPEPVVMSSAGQVLKVVSDTQRRDKNVEVTQVRDETAPVERHAALSMVMFDDKVFFRINKNDSKEEEPIDLCCDDASTTDEDAVKFVSYTPALTGPGSVDGTRTRTGPSPEGAAVTRSESNAASCHGEEQLQKVHTAQQQTSSGPLPAPRPVADHKLKQMFGITSEVEIRLPRVVSCGADTVEVLQAPPPDYTEPIEEDFLFTVNPHHSQGCAQGEGSASRVGRTRKRTKCLCCSPAMMLHYHHVQRRRTKPGPGERREPARRQLKLSPPASASGPSQICRKQAKLQPAPGNGSTTTSTSALPFARKQSKVKAPPLTTSVTAPKATPQTPQSTSASAPLTKSGNATVRKPTQLTTFTTPETTALTPPQRPPTAPGSTQTHAQQTAPTETAPTETPQTVEDVSNAVELQINKAIEQLREALGLKMAALEKLKNDLGKNKLSSVKSI